MLLEDNSTSPIVGICNIRVSMFDGISRIIKDIEGHKIKVESGKVKI